MASIKIRGREYPLRMDLHAMEAIEKEYGDIKGAMEEFRNRNGRTRRISNVKMMFRVMANSGLRRQGLPEDVTGDEIDDFNLADLNELSSALQQAMEESMHAETVGGGEADDEVHDAYEEELEEREKNV